MSEIIYHVDAFTYEPFKGNPAGVCILDTEPSAMWMQSIAMEMNLSETAFVFPGKEYRIIRFFTPEVEVPLCGHATLSASHIIYEAKISDADEEISLFARAGLLKVRKSGTWITMNFPSYPVTKVPVPNEFERVVGVRPSDFISHQVSKRTGILKVSLKGDRVEISGQAKTILKAELFV